MKKCPSCGGMIQDAAMKCKHCKEWLKTSPQQTMAAGPARKTTQPVQRNSYNFFSLENGVFIITFIAVFISSTAASSSVYPLAAGLGETLGWLFIPIGGAVFYNIYVFMRGDSQSLKMIFIIINIIFALLFFSQSTIREAVHSLGK